MEEKNINSPENENENEILLNEEDNQQSVEPEVSADAEANRVADNAEVTSPNEDGAALPNAKETAEVSEPQPCVYAYRWDYNEQTAHDNAKVAKKESHGLRNFAIIMSIACVVSIALLLTVLFIGGGATTQSHSLDALYQECYPSYVAISVISETGVSGAGSGIVMTKDGFIATNYHVVENSKAITVILYDGTKVEAEYVDGDELNDIAILKIAKRNLKPATIGDSSSVRVGDQVMAIGTPYSINYRGTMTSGYISAVNRQYAAENENGTVNKVVTLLQTDTTVNPGNSGGPLFDMNGEVVGIVSMKITGSGYEGLGFAIPINGVIDMLNDIIENGELTISNGGNAVEGASLGISGFDVVAGTEYLLTGDFHYVVTTDELGNRVVNYINAFNIEIPIPLEDTTMLAQYGISEYVLYTAPASGVRVMSTTEGFDSSRKLKVDDIILTANGVDCSLMTNLKQLIADSRVGDELEFEVFRDGQKISVTVELGRSADMN